MDQLRQAADQPCGHVGDLAWNRFNPAYRRPQHLPDEEIRPDPHGNENYGDQCITARDLLTGQNLIKIVEIHNPPLIAPSDSPNYGLGNLMTRHP